jgi:hypothetical protein
MPILRTLATALASFILLGSVTSAPLPASLLGNWDGFVQKTTTVSRAGHSEGGTEYQETKVNWHRAGSAFVRTEAVVAFGYDLAYMNHSPGLVTQITFYPDGRFHAAVKKYPQYSYSGTWTFSNKVLKLKSPGPADTRSNIETTFRQQFIVRSQVTGKTRKDTLNTLRGRLWRTVTLTTETKAQ